jgi:Ca-activated chloride channel family protein
MTISKSLPGVAVALALLVVSLHGQQPATQGGDAFRFKSGVELINVTATVSDQNGRFVPGLQKEDFVVYEDDQRVDVTHFSAERVPVSLGIALDTSGSMSGEKMDAARAALNRFLVMLLDRQDEIFLYRFSNYPVLIQGWTNEREPFLRALERLQPNGGTAMYDAVVDAVPLVAKGQNRKKALLILSDGRDTSSQATVMQAKRLIRESEAMVYAIGIDCGTTETRRPRLDIRRQQRGPFPRPFPFPPGGRGRGWPQPPPQFPDRGSWLQPCNDPVDVEALRDMTDDSGGRTEIIRQPRDLEPATAGIADELSKQYYLGYPAAGKKDGRWHSIRVELRDRSAYRVRARRGYVAS